MTKQEKVKIFTTVILGPIGLFSISKTGGFILTLFAIILAQVFYNELGYLPISWFIFNVILALFWAFSAIKHKDEALYFPYIKMYYAKEDTSIKYLINTLFGMVQFALFLFIIALYIKFTIQ